MLEDIVLDAKKLVLKTNEDLATALLASSKAISTFNAALAGMTEHDDLVEMMENVRAITVEAKAEKAKESEDKAKKVKKPKDPNAPKRPTSAYLEYQNAVRASFREEDPTLTHNETLRKISAAWAVMPQAEKQPFLDITAAKLAQFELEDKAYKAAHPNGYTGNGEADLEMADGETPAKKRGRKNVAEKAAERAAVAVVVAPATPAKVEAKKEKKEKKEKKVVEAPVVATPVAAAKVKARKSAVPTPKAPTPPPVSSESDDSSSDSDDDSDDDSSEEEVAAVVVPPVSNGKKRKDVPESSKSKGKKSKSS